MDILPRILSIEQKKEIIRKNWLLMPTHEVPFIIDIEPRHAATRNFFNDDTAELDWNLNYHNKHRSLDHLLALLFLRRNRILLH